MNRRINKKILLSGVFFIVLLIAVPLILSLFFSQNNQGKIIVDKMVDAPYLQNSRKDVFLVFFGYVGCTKVCTPMLHQLSDFYNSPEFALMKPYVGFTFVNLMPEVTQDQPAEFARFFNPDFEGVYLNQKELMNIDRDFSVFFSQSLNDVTELNHSDYVYLMERQKEGEMKLKAIYMTHPFNRTMVANDIRQSLEDRK